MKNEWKRKAKEDAKNEGCFSSESLASELAALLKEYYIAKIRIAENHVVMNFPNRQQAIITVNI